jgi:hypothetical protein
MQRNYDEKRQFIRMKVDTEVTLTVRDNGQQYSGLCKDLSGSGMLIEMDKDIPIGSNVDIRITSGKNPFVADAQVARVKTAPGEKFIVGLKINDID